MPLQPVTVDAGDDLGALNAIIAQREDVLGPLAAVGNSGGKTILSFDIEPPAPDTHAVLVRGISPDGVETVCTGTIFVSGVLSVVYALRGA